MRAFRMRIILNAIDNLSSSRAGARSAPVEGRTLDLSYYTEMESHAPITLLDGTEQQRRALRRNRLLATGLLVLAAALFFATWLVARPGFWILLLRAGTEAAVVGGLADW